MNTYLYIWNPNRSKWIDQQDAIYRVNNDEEYVKYWSCGNTKKIEIGDTFFLMRLGVEPKGIIGCGYISSEPYLLPHWDEAKKRDGKTALRTDLLFRALSEEPIFHLSYLQNKYQSYNWTPESGGKSMPYEIAAELFNLMQANNKYSFRPVSKDVDLNAEKLDLDEQSELEKSESLRDMSKILDDLRSVKPTDSEQIEVYGKVYKRDNKTIAQLKIVRGHKCQICGTAIKKKDGSFYTEAAHITPKKHKGTELPSNIVVLCPNHHKEFDLGKKEILERDEKVLIVMLNESRYSIDLRL